MQDETKVKIKPPGILRAALSQKKLGIAALISVFLVGGVVLAVDNTPPHTFNTGDVISPDQMNTMFAELYQAVNDLETDPVSRHIFRAYFSGKEATTDGVLSAARSLSVTKTHADTELLITYFDFFEFTSGSSCCSGSWEVLFDGESCSDPGPIIYRRDYQAAGTGTLTGTCASTADGPLPTGDTIVLTIRATPHESGTCNTGIDVGDLGYLIVEEVAIR